MNVQASAHVRPDSVLASTTVRRITFALLFACLVQWASESAAGAQSLVDPDLKADHVATDLNDESGLQTVTLVWVDDNVLLAANRAAGEIFRVNLVACETVTPGPVVGDLDIIAPSANDSQTEYGVQGMALHPAFHQNNYVYVRYDLSPSPGVDTLQEKVTDQPGNFSGSDLTSNVIDRFIWNAQANNGTGELVFDQRIHEVPVQSRYHHGGPIRFGPDGRLYTVYGDQRRTGNWSWNANTAGPLRSVNVATGVVEDNAVIVRLNDDGTIPAGNPFDPSAPDTPDGAAAWFAYGVRNAFGLAFDPATGTLWDTENGEFTFDEINRVEPGFNSGYKHIMGPIDHPEVADETDQLVELPGSQYSDPEFAWADAAGVTSIYFLYGSALGEEFDNLVLTSHVNSGFLWALPLNEQRDDFLFEHPGLVDGVDDRPNAASDPRGTEAEELLFGTDFGGGFTGPLAIERGADNLPYVLTGDGNLYRIRPAEAQADLNMDGVVGVADLLIMLGAWGPCRSCPADLNGDAHVTVSDLLELLSAWGACG